jgi:hypothetical protein
MKIYNLIITALSVYLLSMLTSCNTNDKMTTTKIYTNINVSFVDTLSVKSNSIDISKMRLEITGNIKGKAKIYYSHVPFKIEQLVILEGKFNEEIVTDWYDKTCLIKFTPESEDTEGQVEVKFIVF